MPVTGTDRQSRSGTPTTMAVFLLGLCLAAGAAWWWQYEIDRDAETRFQRSVERVTFDISRRFRAPVQGLNGVKSLYAASKHVKRATFQTYVESLDLPNEFPGVRGFGFIQRVMHPDLGAFVAAERADGAPGFAIRQLADKNHDDLYVIKFIEPAANNAGAQGLDIGSEANRRAAAQRAVDSGEPTITAAITLVQDERKTPGVLLYVPVYANETHPATTGERRASLVGLLYAPIVLAELLDTMADVGAGRIDFELFDTAPDASGALGGALLYDADNHLAMPTAAQDGMKERRFSITSPLWLPVGDLTLHASSTSGFDAAIDHSSKWLVFAGITLLSTLLALLLRQQASGRRRAEFRALRMTEQLRQDQERSADFSRSASDWFWETDAQHRFCYFSDNFETVYGRASSELLGISRKEFLALDALNPPETIAAHVARLDAHLPFKNFEYQTRNRTGETIWVMISGLPHFDLDGRFAGYRGTGSLITGRKRKEEELVRAMAMAETASVAKSRFLATMSHELRTPMNGILGMAQMLLMPTLQDDKRQDYARIILNSGKTLLTLLNDILDVSKVEAGKVVLESTAFEPGQILHETSALFAQAAAQKGLRIESAWRGPAQRYLGDPHRLRQMVSNLVGNALKFTVQGHIRIEAREVERDGQRALLEFTVTDTGIGIPDDKQSHLFKPFSQADSSTTRQYGGTGLGLSLVRSMAMLMGGDVGIDSEAGQGSCFWFRIRADLVASGVDSRDDVRHARVGADDTATGGPPGSPGIFSGHILVVDDNMTNRTVLKAMLNKPGVRCDFAEDGQQAVEAITGGMAPDLVLMDCQMPVLDGYQATMRIRRWEMENAQPHLTIVALTASAFEDDRQHCLDVGMDDFLTKPIAIEKLMATLGHWLGRGREMAGAAEVIQAPLAAITPQEEGPPVFDEATLLGQLGGDRELAKAIILSAIEDIPGYFEQLEQAIAAGNWKAAARQAHTLKGLIGQIGGIRLSARMKALDDHLKGGGATDSATVATLRNDYQLLSGALARWMASPATTTPMPAGNGLAIDQIGEIYRELDALLAQNNFDAIGRFKDLQGLLVGTAVSPEVLAEIAEAGWVMTEFRFDLAREHLRRIAAQQGWETKAS